MRDSNLPVPIGQMNPDHRNSQITGKSDEGSEFATEFAGGNSADESRLDSKQPDGNTGNLCSQKS